jgi:UDP:flavonoid glycosyltransferase YjiC (YdhE family)
VAIGLARLLAGRGHDVRVVGPADFGDRIAAAGCRHVPFPAALELDPALGRRIDEQRPLLERLFFGPHLPETLVAAGEADVVVVDYLLRSTVAAAEQLDTPHAVLVHTIHPFHDDATNALVDRAAAAIVTVPRAFDDWPDAPPHVAHVGAIAESADSGEWESPWRDDDPRPLVVVTLGTTYMAHEDVLARIATALDGLDLRVLVLTGPELAPDEVSFGGDAVVRDYVPHAAVLPHASLVVAHGGTGTLLAALAAGVPVVCLPLGRDQPANARRLEELRLGVVVERDAEPAAIRDAVTGALASAELRERVAAFAGTLAPQDAVAVLERL